MARLIAVLKVRVVVALACMCATLLACATISPDRGVDIQSVIREVESRPLTFSDYPQPGQTYLSFSQAHGFQVTYIASRNLSWLWYPGNATALQGQYKLDVIRGLNAICWRYASNTRNPVLNTSGGSFACQELDLSRKSIVARLRGDPFRLASGRVLYRLERCSAPTKFQFDRTQFRCNG